MTDFYYRTSNDTLWIGTAENPSLARFGRRGFEIHRPTMLPGETLLAQPVGEDPLAAWRDFASAMATVGITITAAHAPSDIARRLPPHEQPPPATISLAMLIANANPFEIDVWGVGPLSRDEVAAAIAARKFVRTPNHTATRLAHTRRVAYLATHPHSWAPISVECGPSGFEVVDGYHRIAAAIFSARQTIAADLSGFESVIRRLTSPIAA